VANPKGETFLDLFSYYSIKIMLMSVPLLCFIMPSSGFNVGRQENGTRDIAQIPSIRSSRHEKNDISIDGTIKVTCQPIERDLREFSEVICSVLHDIVIFLMPGRKYEWRVQSGERPGATDAIGDHDMRLFESRREK
jgi:hypothetical protein